MSNVISLCQHPRSATAYLACANQVIFLTRARPVEDIQFLVLADVAWASASGACTVQYNSATEQQSCCSACKLAKSNHFRKSSCCWTTLVYTWSKCGSRITHNKATHRQIDHGCVAFELGFVWLQFAFMHGSVLNFWMAPYSWASEGFFQEGPLGDFS